MFKKINILFVFIAIVLGTFLVNSCSDSSSNPSDNNPVNLKIAGAWELYKVYFKTDEGTYMDYKWDTGIEVFLTLDSNGTFDYTENTVDTTIYLSGNWTVSNNKIILKDAKKGTMELDYFYDTDREYTIPKDSIGRKTTGLYYDKPAELFYHISRVKTFQKDNNLMGRWGLKLMEIKSDIDTNFVTLDGTFTLDFQSSTMRLDSIILGLTIISTYDWYVYDGKIVADNDFDNRIWKYSISNDTLTTKNKAIIDGRNVIITNTMKKLN